MNNRTGYDMTVVAELLPLPYEANDRGWFEDEALRQLKSFGIRLEGEGVTWSPDHGADLMDYVMARYDKLHEGD